MVKCVHRYSVLARSPWQAGVPVCFRGSCGRPLHWFGRLLSYRVLLKWPEVPQRTATVTAGADSRSVQTLAVETLRFYCHAGRAFSSDSALKEANKARGISSYRVEPSDATGNGIPLRWRGFRCVEGHGGITV